MTSSALGVGRERLAELRAAHGKDLFAEQPRDAVAGMLSLRVQDPCIQLFAFRIVLAVVGLDPQLHLAEHLPERRNARIEPALREYRQRRDSDDAVARGLADTVRRGPQIPEYAADAVGVLPPGAGERDAVAAPDEQFGSQVALKQPYVPTDGARGDALLERSLQKALVPSCCFECLE